MKSRIKLDLEDFIRAKDGKNADKPLWELADGEAELLEHALREIVDRWVNALAFFAGTIPHRPSRWNISRHAMFAPPALEVVLGVNTFLTFELVAKDVPDDTDRVARVTKNTAPSAYCGRLVKQALLVVVDRIHNAAHDQAIVADSFASGGRMDFTNPRFGVVEFNPFNRGDVKRAFNELMENPIRE